MRLTNKKILNKFQTKHPDTKGWIDNWCKKIKEIDWNTRRDIEESFPSSDWIGKGVVVFNVRHNHYRLVTLINLRKKTIFACWIGNHKEYDRIPARNRCG